MAVKITCIGTDEQNVAQFVATDLATGEEVQVKNFYEKSKEKWHIVLGPNSANRKYIAHNEVLAKKDDNGEYVVEDKTTGPRTLGTAQPDKKLVPYMTAEDKEMYDAIIARAIENKNSQTKVELSDEEKLMKAIAKLEAKLAAKLAAKDEE